MTGETKTMLEALKRNESKYDFFLLGKISNRVVICSMCGISLSQLVQMF